MPATPAHKDVLKLFNYGIHALGSEHAGELDMIICTWVMQGSFEEGEVIVNVGKDRLVLNLITESRKFALTILGRDNADIAKSLAAPSGEREDTIKKYDIRRMQSGMPYFGEGLGYLGCSLERLVELAHGVLLIGTPQEGGVLREGESLTLHEFNSMVE